jgi:serine phosphatase RsbU (regulator of sigma subunit)/Tfp pilus assembly protein PilF
MRRIKLIFFIIIIFRSAIGFCQEDKIDSLQSVINDQAHNDTVLANAYIELSELLYLENIDTLTYFSRKVLDLGAKNLTLINNNQKRLLHYKSEALNNIGYVFKRNGEVDSAVYYYQKALKIAKDINDYKGASIRCNNLGVIYDNLGDFEKAKQYYKKALSMSQLLGDSSLIALNYNNLGFLYDKEGLLKESSNYYFLSLKYCISNGSKSTTYNNIGYSYRKQSDYETALVYYNKALEFAELDSKNISMKATALNNIGAVFEIQEKYDTTLIIYKRVLSYYKVLGEERSKATLYSNIGVLYLNHLRRETMGLAYLDSSLVVAKKINNKFTLAKYNMTMGQFYTKKKEYNKAIDFLREAYVLYKDLNIVSYVEEAAKSFSLCLHFLGQHEQAYYKLIESNQIKDSLVGEKTLLNLNKERALYEYDKQKALDDFTHEKELALNEEEKKRQQVITIAVTSGLALVALFLIFVYRRLQITKKQKTIIEEKKKEVEQQKIAIEIAHKETERQKEVVEKQKAEVEVINEQLEEVSKEISDSINYAEMIQQAVLPSFNLEELNNESFIYFNPKDKVSGDFYWLEQKGEYSGYAVADCTGHGIPGAFISMIGTILLNEIYNSKKIDIPNQILDELSRLVRLTLTNKEGYTMKDGMDISFVVLNNETKVLYFSGANNPVWITSAKAKKRINKVDVLPITEVKGKYIYEIKGDKQPIGEYGENIKPFTLSYAHLEQGDAFYIFSDGYVDQFGGENNKKFKAKPFRELLLSIQEKSMEEQKVILAKNFQSWKGEYEQIDDVTVLGVKV